MAAPMPLTWNHPLPGPNAIPMTQAQVNHVMAAINQASAQNGQNGGRSNKPRILIPPAALNARRPLNSFIAYRSYYARMFESVQQKSISGLLTFLWSHDPFKPKWTILAKAYSVIRDAPNMGSTRLDIFLAINAPFVGIIPPQDYLQTMGWGLDVQEDGQRILQRAFVPDVANMNQDIRSTHHTVHDIIQHSYEEGYVPPDGGSFAVGIRIPGTQNIMVTQVHPQLRLPYASQSMDTQVQGMATNAAAAAPVNPAFAQTNSDDPIESVPALNGLVDDAAAGMVDSTLDVDGIGETLSEEIRREMKEMEEAANEKKLEEQRSRIPGHNLPNEFKKANIAYPYNEHFDPDNAPNITLDPYGGDEFDAYNIDDFIDLNMFADDD